ncbi:unnamed protein product [Urochloa decumbens]|uniref:Uncharacterized protein n=1 Tax=Urochloa decumbens TaxID=240449 RepID=A0ABC9FZ65_9POAL
MGLSRRFLNLIVNDSIPGVRSLRCIDLTRNEFFYPAGTPLPPSAASTLEQIRLPSPTLSFKSSGISCSPLSGRKVFCTGRSGDAFIFDADTRQVVTTPTITKPKWEPVSIFVPSAGGDDADPDPDGTLFVMERRPKQEAKSVGHQFEAFVYGRISKTSPSKSWHGELLPAPPYLRDSKYNRHQFEMTSYAVVGGGSHICISAEGHAHYQLSPVAVTYCLDTVRHTWSKVGDWKLPFRGKAEYVHELKLWFGIGDKYPVLAAADLSTMDSDSSLVRSWDLGLDDTLKYESIDDVDLESGETLHKEWREPQESQLVHLGAGRFCVASSFQAMGIIRTSLGNELTFKRFAVFTGVEVMPRVHGLAELQMVQHKSKRTPDATLIDLVF